ncbi:MAG: type II toxin-antitoxin system VapC family toxin [Pseudomonadota bacterium]
MKLLLDTHLLLWSATGQLPVRAARLLGSASNALHFSAASLWEVAIKNSLGRDDFDFDVQILRRGLQDAGYIEIPVTAAHAAAVAGLPLLHKDPFDRMLLAQAAHEGLELVTNDGQLARYEGYPVRLV